MSDLSKLWLMLSFRVHGRAGAHGAQRGTQHATRHGGQHGAQSGVRLSWGEFHLAFGDSWHPMIVKRIFDIMDRDGDGVISFEDLALALALTLALALALTRCDLIRGLCAWHLSADLGAGDLG